MDGRHDVVHGATVHDRGRLIDLGQVRNREGMVFAGISVYREGGADEEPLAMRGVLVVGERRAGRDLPGTAEPDAQLGVEWLGNRTGGLRIGAPPGYV